MEGVVGGAAEGKNLAIDSKAGLLRREDGLSQMRYALVRFWATMIGSSAISAVKDYCGKGGAKRSELFIASGGFYLARQEALPKKNSPKGRRSTEVKFYVENQKNRLIFYR